MLPVAVAGRCLDQAPIGPVSVPCDGRGRVLALRCAHRAGNHRCQGHALRIRHIATASLLVPSAARAVAGDQVGSNTIDTSTFCGMKWQAGSWMGELVQKKSDMCA